MRRFRLAGYLALDGMILAGALVTALWLRFDGNVPSHYFQRAIDVLPWFVAGGFVIFAGSGLYSGLWQYASIHEAARIGLASLVAGLWLAFLSRPERNAPKGCADKILDQKGGCPCTLVKNA